MARHPSRKQKGNSKPRLSDTAEKFGSGEVDEHFHTRDKVSLNNERGGSDDEDYLTGQTEEVFGLNLPEERDDVEEEEEYDEEPVVKKGRKVKPVKDDSHRGRFGKAAVDSDDSDEDDEESEEDSEDDPDAEGWGRSYYSRPSTRREKDTGTTEDEEKREEERKLELLEAKRLQRKARMAMKSEEDWGLEALKAEKEVEKTSLEIKESATKTLPTPPSTASPSTLTTHLALSDPVKLALLREFPLVVERLKKTERGVEKMRQEAEKGEGQLNQAFGWLHYQTLLTYATTLAFYIHLSALPAISRPDFTTHPILPRLLQLKQNLVMLETNDLDAASIDEDDTIELYDRDAMAEDEDDDEDLADGKRELLSKLMSSDVLGSGGVLDWEDDAENLWDADSLEEDELDELKKDAAEAWDDEEGSDDGDEDEEVEEDDEEESGSGSELSLDDDAIHAIAAKLRAQGPSSQSKGKAPKSVAKADTNSTITPYTLLEEPAFVSSKTASQSKSSTSTADDHGDPTHLSSADASDKAAKKHSLRFHTSKIAATSARRAAARQERMGGDDDIPYRDRKAARDAALRKSGGQEDGEDLDGSEWTEKDRKRAREVMEEEGGEEAVEGDDGYYDLVKRRKTEAKQAKQEEYDAGVSARKADIEATDAHSGPRSLTRAIEKNKGLTPHRSKSVRNPRVKKRERYEKAKRKVSSQRAVYKGGQGALAGSYQGEKSGISMVSKSRRF